MRLLNWSNAIPGMLSVLLLCAGCGDTTKPKPAEKPAANAEQGHSHGHAEHGPHEGELIELGGGKYHAEVVHDDAASTVTIYLLDEQAKQAVPIAATELLLNLVVEGKPLQAKLAAAPQEGEAAGKSSRFAVKDEAIIKALDAHGTTGRIAVTIEDKEYSGKLDAHAGHDHKH